GGRGGAFGTGAGCCSGACRRRQFISSRKRSMSLAEDRGRLSAGRRGVACALGLSSSLVLNSVLLRIQTITAIKTQRPTNSNMKHSPAGARQVSCRLLVALGARGADAGDGIAHFGVRLQVPQVV